MPFGLLGWMNAWGEATRVECFVLYLTSPGELVPGRLPVGPDSVFVGRDADLTIQHATMSRRHARVWVSDGGLLVEDCGSTNGTFVNGRRILGPTAVQVGDTVAFGAVAAIVALPDARSPAQFPVGTADRAQPTRPLTATRADPARTETTRYLCAEAHLNPEFRREVLRETVEQPFRAIGPNYGMDVAPVASHAIAARRRELVRDLALLAILVVAAVLLAGALREPRLWAALTHPDAHAVRLLAGELWPGALAVLAGAWLVVSGETAALLRVLTTQLTPRRFRPHAVTPPLGPRARRRVAELARLSAGNVVVFSDFEPFVGSGHLWETWSFAVDITKGLRKDAGGERATPRPFSVEDVHRHLSVALHRIGMPELTVGDRLFVDGRAVRADARLLPDRFAPPVTRLDRDELWEMTRNPGSRARAYLCCEVAGWRGQLVTTTFVRAVRFDGSLFVESSAFLLAPLLNRHRAVDGLIGAPGSELVLDAVGRGARLAVPLLVASPWRVGRTLATMLRATGRRRRDRRVIADGWAFGYGARASIRELAAGDEFRRYFQKMDGEMFHKVVQEALFRGVVEFLTDHDIDIEQVKAAQTTIIQGSVINKADMRGAQGVSFGASSTNTVTNSGAPSQPAARAT